MTALTDGQINLVLAMVDASAAVLAPDEREDAMDEYTEQVQATRRIPGFDPRTLDDSSAGAFDANLFLGVGLAMLGQAAMYVLTVATDTAVKRGVDNVLDLFRRKPKPDVDELAAQIVKDALTRLASTGQLPAERLQVVITLQVDALRAQAAQESGSAR